MIDQLPPRQQQILTFITDQQATGFTPSMREIGAAVGLASTSSVRAQLQNLEEIGYIRLAAGKARAIKVLRGRCGPTQAMKWISVDDELPHARMWVLVYTEFQSPPTMTDNPYSIAKRYGNGDWYTTSYLLSPDCKVTHWARLYKPEEQL